MDYPAHQAFFRFYSDEIRNRILIVDTPGL